MTAEVKSRAPTSSSTTTRTRATDRTSPALRAGSVPTTFRRGTTDVTSQRDREEYLLARRAEIDQELEALRVPTKGDREDSVRPRRAEIAEGGEARRGGPPVRRDYAVGLPVSVSID